MILQRYMHNEKLVHERTADSIPRADEGATIDDVDYWVHQVRWHFPVKHAALKAAYVEIQLIKPGEYEEPGT